MDKINKKFDWKKLRNSEIFTMIAVIVVVFVLVIVSYLLYQNYREKQILKECLEIENSMKNLPEFQMSNIECRCYPGSYYYDRIANITSEKVKEMAELRYVVACDFNGTIKLYPIWRSR